MLRFGSCYIRWKRNCPSLLWPISRTDWALQRGAVRATAEILIRNLRNGCEKTFWGKRGFMLQESTADAFENSASYCVFITCISSSHTFLCIIVLGCFFGGFHKKKKKSLSHTPYPRLGWSHIWHLCWQRNQPGPQIETLRIEQELGSISTLCYCWLCEAVMPSSWVSIR